MSFLKILSSGLIILCAMGSLATAKVVTAGFNDEDITWVDFESGLERAKSECKPVFVLFHTDWCPHCKRYRAAFKEPSIVELSKEFVFVIVDRDFEEATNDRYAPDGGYVPRSVVLNNAGSLQTQFSGPRTDYKYFLDPDNYRELEELLSQAKAAFDPAQCDFKPS